MQIFNIKQVCILVSFALQKAAIFANGAGRLKVLTNILTFRKTFIVDMTDANASLSTILEMQNVRIYGRKNGGHCNVARKGVANGRRGYSYGNETKKNW